MIRRNVITALKTILIIVFLITFMPQRSDSEQYKWKDEKGSWHFTNDPQKIPPEFREEANPTLFRDYVHYEDDPANVFRYEGYQPLKITDKVSIGYSDYVIVTNYVNQGWLDTKKKYRHTHFDCLYLDANAKVHKCQLSALLFLGRHLVIINNREDYQVHYIFWRLLRTGGNVAADIASPTVIFADDGWRSLFYQ